jgi:hypothetical protein
LVADLAATGVLVGFFFFFPLAIFKSSRSINTVCLCDFSSLMNDNTLFREPVLPRALQ